MKSGDRHRYRKRTPRQRQTRRAASAATLALGPSRDEIVVNSARSIFARTAAANAARYVCSHVVFIFSFHCMTEYSSILIYDD